MKPITTELMPRFLKSLVASRTSFSSSAVSTSPRGGRMRSEMAIRLRRFTSGWLCHGTMK